MVEAGFELPVRTLHHYVMIPLSNSANTGHPTDSTAENKVEQKKEEGIILCIEDNEEEREETRREEAI